jgi:hypothetical protein
LFPGSPQVPYLTIGPYLAAGVVEDQYGVFTLTAHSFARFGGYENNEEATSLQVHGAI